MNINRIKKQMQPLETTIETSEDALITIDTKKRKKKMSLINQYQTVFGIIISLIVITMIIFTHFYYKNQITRLRKQSEETKVTLIKQEKDIEEITKSIKEIEDESKEIGAKRQKYLTELSECNESITKVRDDHQKASNQLLEYQDKMAHYHEENVLLKLQIERKQKALLSVIH